MWSPIIKEFVKNFIPPMLLNLFKKIQYRRYGWHGDYKSWQEAKSECSGYDSEEILRKVKSSLLKVKKGESVYERDSVLFDKIEYSWPLLAGLLLATTKSCGTLSVLDFGGSLGSSYFQNQKFLNLLLNVSWNIIEQPHFVREGKLNFEDERLHFYEDVETCVKDQNPDVLILSSVLCYLEKPYETLEKLLSHHFSFVIVDRTPFHTKGYDRITIQRVPPWIYEASYPCWIFDKRKFLSFFQTRGYVLIEEFEAFDPSDTNIKWEGFVFKVGDRR